MFHVCARFRVCAGVPDCVTWGRGDKTIQREKFLACPSILPL